MILRTRVLATTAGLMLIASAALAAPYRQEHVTGGALDLSWRNGYDTSNSMQPLTLDASDPAYANPSGDHTVGLCTTAIPDSGGIIVTTVDAAGINDYMWEAYMNTGAGNARRGIIVRATPGANAKNFYYFVIESGLFQIRFRRIQAGALPTDPPTVVTLGNWFANTLPFSIGVNQWVNMKVIATGSTFRCFLNGYELTSPPITDPVLPTGDVGCYDFRFDIGNIPTYYDDLLLTDMSATPARNTTWGAVKSLYRR